MKVVGNFAYFPKLKGKFSRFMSTTTEEKGELLEITPNCKFGT